MRITEDMTIREIAENYPDTHRVLARYGLMCPGCRIPIRATLREAAGMAGVDKRELLADLNHTIGGMNYG